MFRPVTSLLRAVILGAGTLSASLGGALANDSAAELDAGGLVLVKDPDISLLEEDLRIGLDRIGVRYVFRNRSEAPRTVRIAFPLPPIDGDALVSSAQNLPFEDRANFVGFTVVVDGAPITPHLEERAFLADREVGDLLKKHGVPLNPMRRSDVEAAIKALAPNAKAELVEAKLIDAEEGPGGGLWRSEAKFHWEQIFPAGRDVAISHDYVPVKGSFLVDRSQLDDRDLRDRFCLDAAGAKGIARLIGAAKGTGTVHGAVVPYIVTTARNWAGTIGRFTLTIDKGLPTTLVSLCRTGLTKTGPTTFTWQAKDYVPDADIRILYVSGDASALGIK